MTNANALPIQERLRAVTEADAYAEPWTFGETCREAADRIDALEKALRRLVTAEEDGCLCSEMEMATAIDEARAALGEGVTAISPCNGQ